VTGDHVSEYVGQTFQLRLRIYSEKWTLLKPLMWNPFIRSEKAYILTYLLHGAESFLRS